MPDDITSRIGQAHVEPLITFEEDGEDYGGDEYGDSRRWRNYENTIYEKSPTTLALDGAGLGNNECKEGKNHDHRQKLMDCSDSICLLL